ncbi:EAL domain-containing protein [Novosphingobium sp.]|uniref:putative bifunctional diguanylate cyclase/phosphodiesterase n=1 Tax=Novosphingobium sp. TaxID=1874826 RepID=UPI0025FB33E2|nr:EAL domain-containing protein [Novosphingobium sp.]
MVSRQAVLRTAVAPELRDWVDNRLISAHIRIVKPMVAGTLLNAAVIVAALIGQIGALHIAMFAVSSIAAAYHRMWLAEGIARGRRQKRLHKIAAAFASNTVWMGLNMGVLLAIWLPAVSTDTQILLAISATTQIASAAYTVRTLPRSAAVYVASQALGLTMGLARMPTPTTLGAIAILLAASALLIRMAFTARDLFITRILSDRELAASARTVKLLLNEYEESGSDLLFETDRDGRLVGVSQRLAAAIGRPAEELEGALLSEILKRDAAIDELQGAIAGRKRITDLVATLDGTDGQSRWWSITGRPCFPVDGDRAAFRGVITDVTSQRIAEGRAQRMAQFDTLTGLPNRASFDLALEHVLAQRCQDDQVALLLVDIDHFKHINDVHGHPVGDALLRLQAEAMAGYVEESGLGGIAPVVARLGGDEFAIIVTGEDACDHAVRLSEILIDVLSQPIMVEGHDLAVTVSIGVALAPYHSDQKLQLQSYAGIALHSAKQGGRATWEMFEPGMDAVLHERHSLALDLRYAVPRGELRLFIQPLVDVASEAMTGYEALLRWQHPTRGLVAPDTFIPIAEETGLIVPIGEWVIRSAFAEAASWEGDQTIAINLSAVQIANANLLPVIVNALGETGLDPARVEFEITESVLLHNSEANIEVLNRLHSLGVKIALDDFGTGYASLTYLLTFPFDKIKIDRRFISELSTREESRAIVGAVIALANQLGMCTLAEGVEEPEQLDALRQHGCRMVQGWLFGKALPSEEYHPRREIALAAPAPVRLPRTRKVRIAQTSARRARA